MRNRILKTLALGLAFTLLLGVSGAFAAFGEYDYDLLGGSAGVYIDGGNVTIDEANVTVDGTVSVQGDTVTVEGVKMEYREIGDWTAGSASASGEASSDSSDEAASGAKAGQTGIVVKGDVDSTRIVIGGPEDRYTASDGRRYNTVIELWADDKDAENALKPGTARSLLDNDVETVPGVGLAVLGDLVTVDNTFILTEGANRSAFLNSASMGQYVDTVIRDSTLVSRSDGWIFPSFKCIYRAARTALCTSWGNTWMYNTRMYSDSWGNYSMEGANGIEHYYVINGYSESYVGGYGLFTLGMGDDLGYENNHVRVYGSKMLSPQFGWICDDGPEVVVGSMADMASDEHAMDHYDGEITGDMYVSGDGRSFFGGAVNAAVICFDMAPYTELAADITIENSVFTTAAEDLVREDGTPVGNLLELDPSILHDDAISGGMEYFGLGYVNGATFWLRGANSDLKLIDSELRSETGILFHSTVDYSNWSGSNLAGAEAVGYHVSMKDMDTEGDIVHDDYQRKMFVTLDGATLTGAANYYDCGGYADRMAAYVEEAYAEAEATKAAWETEHGAGSSLLGTKEELLGWLVYDESYDETMTGLELTLENGAVWNVTELSTLTALNIGKGCTVNGVITENPDGTITVTPAAASEEASGEASGSSGEPASVSVETLTERTEFPGGVTLTSDDYYGAPDGFCVVMVVDGTVVSQKAGSYKGDVVFEVVPLARSSDGLATYTAKSIVTKSGGDLFAAGSAVSGTVTEDGLYGADIVADAPHMSVVTVVNGDYRIEDSRFRLLQTGLHTSGGNDFSGDGCAISVTGDSTVTVKDVDIVSDGITRTNLFGGLATHDAYPKTYVIDSVMTANGDPEGADGAVWVLGLHGQVRTTMFDDYYANYFYNTTMNSIGWAVLAVDGVEGPTDDDLAELNARYVDGQGYAKDDGTIMNTAEFAVAATGLTDEYLAALDGVHDEASLKAMPELNDGSLFYYAGKNILVDSALNITDMDDGHTGYSTYSIGANSTIYSGTTVDATYGAVQSNEYSTVAFVNGSVVNARKSILMNFSHGGGVCFVSDAELNAGEIAFAVKGSGDGYEESVAPEGASKEFSLMGGPSGTNLYVRSSKITAPELLVTFDSDDPGDLFSSTITVDDSIAPKDETFDVTKPNNWRAASPFWGSNGGQFHFNEAVEAYFQDCRGETALKGNIYNCHQWTSKNLVLTLDNCEITGLISSGWCEHDVDVIEPGIGALEESFVGDDGLVHGNRENMGKITCHASETVNNGVIVTLQNGTVWNVTETSYVSVLNVDDTSVVNGTVTVLPSGIIMVEPIA